MPRLAVSEQAEDDLHAIAAYIAEQDGKLRATKATARLLKAMDNLAFMPGIGSRRHYLDTASRAFPVPPWLIVYELLRRAIASVFCASSTDGAILLIC